MYFTKCKTAEELKKAYREIVKKLHPDKGGSKEEFQAMQNEFEKAWESLKNIHVNKDGEKYERETKQTATAFMDMIDRILRMDGVDVEMCGSWIWCSGDTKPHRKELKDMGFRFSRNKSAWYYHEGTYRRRCGKTYSLDEIRDMYGSNKFKRTSLRTV